MEKRFEEQLVREGARTQAQVATLERDLAGMIESTWQSSTDDEHDPDGATIAFERAQVIALLAQARRRLAEVHRALERIGAGVYGRCERCGRAIGSDRLAALPFATACVRCAATTERNRSRGPAN